MDLSEDDTRRSVADIFGPGGNGSAPPAIDVKSLHAKID